MIRVAVITISDRAAKGEYEDKSGKRIIEIIEEKIVAKVELYKVLPDDKIKLKEELLNITDNLKFDLVLTTGGTGLSPRDITPEVTKDIIEKEVPGIPEAIRMVGFSKTKFAILSRAVAGIRNKTLIINLPGSKKAVEESLDIILPAVEHGILIMKGELKE